MNNATYVTATSVLAAKKIAAPAKKKASSFTKKGRGPAVEKEAVSSSTGKRNELYYKPSKEVNLKEFPDKALDSCVGKVFALPAKVVEKLSAIGYPNYLGAEFESANRQALLYRKDTKELFTLLDESAEQPSQPIILSGEKGVGKSALLLQAVARSISSGWIVLYVPAATEWVNGSKPFAKVEDGKFTQTAFTSSILGQIKDTNSSILAEIPLKKAINIENHQVAEGANLVELLEVGIKDQQVSQQVLDAFLNEIQSNKTTPTLIAVDEINAFYTLADYNDVNGRLLPAQHLMLVKSFLNFFSQRKTLANGVVLGATSKTFSRFQSPALEAALAEGKSPMNTPLRNVEVKTYTKPEAKGLLQYYKDADIMFEDATEDQLNLKYTTTNGNGQKLYQACRRLV
ncbi:hypothetical protein K493DRAFT_352882 [Basidiobolus meristosporus CBS 931.73]|uniref:Small ribosomal subunit protein mS29 n=1 Tax=Basidiobolus meristosporus CBS 931.73 TaxID=1314790 RepID=A0A1Y1Y8D7_9FUNG|nr:hypothetical protein K493DRAFT_352882 [Basidiobolus meristosporus CBS 931.73]|eukprot:ORX94006.1 hypothetical protein K493DRAFT_352882 [Basidiobolus meristosporus CBS 931.73]